MRPAATAFPEPLPLPASPLDDLFVNTRRLARREALFRAGDPVTAFHVVRRGSVKTLVIGEDGSEHITGHHHAGDIVGLDGLGQRLHACDAVALEHCDVASLPFTDLDRASREPRLARALFELISGELRRNREMILLLGGMSAEARVAALLLDLSRRKEGRGASPTELMLSMTREEIASFLGLSLETVSRTLSRLQAEGLLRVEGRAVSLLDPWALERRHQ